MSRDKTPEAERLAQLNSLAKRVERDARLMKQLSAQGLEQLQSKEDTSERHQ